MVSSIFTTSQESRTTLGHTPTSAALPPVVSSVYTTHGAAGQYDLHGLESVETDQGVALYATDKLGRRYPDDIPGYVTKIGQVGPLVVVLVREPGYTIEERGDRLEIAPDDQAYVLAVDELSNHPALAALLAASQGHE